MPSKRNLLLMPFAFPVGPFRLSCGTPVSHLIIPKSPVRIFAHAQRVEGTDSPPLSLLYLQVDVVAELKTSKLQGKTTLANAVLQENTQKNWLALAKESERQLKGSTKGGGNGVRLSASSELEDFRIRTDSIASPIEAEDLGPGALPMTMYSIVVMPRRVKMMDVSGKPVRFRCSCDEGLTFFGQGQGRVRGSMAALVDILLFLKESCSGFSNDPHIRRRPNGKER